MGNYDYDVMVFGRRAPGEHRVAALEAGGKRVAQVERELVGGMCLYYARIPSKTSAHRVGRRLYGLRL